MPQADLVSELLSSRGLRRTAARGMVLGILTDRGRPLSHAELSRIIGVNVDRVTLYRTLETLHEAGLLHRVIGKDGVWRYCCHDPDAPACPGNHPHFLCLGCGEMVCLTDQALPLVTVPAQYEVKGKQLVVFGFCAACRTRRSHTQR